MQIPKRFDYSFALLLSLVLLGVTFNGLPDLLGKLADASILIGLVLGSAVALSHFAVIGKISRSLSWIILALLLLLLSYLLTLLLNGIDVRALFVVGELVLVFGFFLGVTVIRWNGANLSVLGLFAIIFIMVIFVLWLSAGSHSHFPAYLSNKNALGGILYGLLYFVLALSNLGQKRALVRIAKATTIIGLIVLIATNSRASILAFLAMSFTFLLFGVIAKSRLRWTSYFFLVVLFILAFSLIYSSLNDYLPTEGLNGALMDLTGGRLYSGRNEIWPALQELIVQRPFLGYGAGAHPRDFFDTDLSSHNLYYQISLQVGLLGLFLLLLLLWSIWITLWHGRKDWLGRLSSAYMIGFMVHQIFEVSMTQNNLAVGLLQWLILGIGVSRVIHNDNKISNNFNANQKSGS